jgi:hypothetical protein
MPMFQLTCVSHGPALATPLPEPREHSVDLHVTTVEYRLSVAVAHAESL